MPIWFLLTSIFQHQIEMCCSHFLESFDLKLELREWTSWRDDFPRCTFYDCACLFLTLTIIASFYSHWEMKKFIINVIGFCTLCPSCFALMLLWSISFLYEKNHVKSEQKSHKSNRERSKKFIKSSELIKRVFIIKF